MPIFAKELDTITVDGKKWAQVDLFTSLSWVDINAVCPGRIRNGLLNGYDMTGWTWASVDDVNALFNYYIGSPQLGTGPDLYSQLNSQWAPAFFGAGFRITDYEDVTNDAVWGWTRSLSLMTGEAHIVYLRDYKGADSLHDTALTNISLGTSWALPRVGGFFWKY